MNRQRLLAAGALTMLALAGCTGPQKTAETIPLPPTSAAPAPQDVAQVAKDAGCANYKPTPKADLELFVVEGGTCTLPDGADAIVRRFPNDEAMKQWWTMLPEFSPDPNMTATAGLILLEADSVAAANDMKGRLAR